MRHTKKSMVEQGKDGDTEGLQEQGQGRESLFGSQNLSLAWKLGGYGRLKEAWLLWYPPIDKGAP